MSSLSEHPTVKRFRERTDSATVKPRATPLDAQWLRQLCLDAGADDVGFCDIDRTELAGERADILRFFSRTRSLISFVLRMNREPIRSTARSAANVEFHQTGERVNEIAHHIVSVLSDRGIRATNPAMGFPMGWIASGRRFGASASPGCNPKLPQLSHLLLVTRRASCSALSGSGMKLKTSKERLLSNVASAKGKR